MRGRRNTIHRPCAQQGAAMVEYLVVAAMVAVLVFANPGAVQELVEAMQRMYRAFTWALSQTIH